MTFHVFVVDIIMFTKRIVVSRYCIFDMNVLYIMCAASSHSVGLWLAQCWVMVGAMLVMVGTLLGNGWCNVG